jgi:C-8 sterol isomerase
MGWVFDPDRLHEIARGAVGLPREEMFGKVVEDLARAWPGHVETRQHWLFNLAAGATGIMTVLHGSLSEYVILFGTPVGTEAFSGRYRLDIYDFVLCGEMWTYLEDRHAERVVTRPGERALLPRGRVKGFRLLEDTWMLEYGRGIIPASLPGAMADALFSALDGTIIVDTIRVYGRQVIRELLRGKI